MALENFPTILLKFWGIGRSEANEPLLVIEPLDGAKFAIQLPALTAQQMGAALIDAGNDMVIKRDTKPN